MNYMDEYKRWRESPHTDEALRCELSAITDEAEAEDMFYRSLEFGTAGLRGILGAGTNRMNVHIVRQASKGLADYIRTIKGADKKGVVIAYDSRIKSDEFALAAALVLCENGIKTYLFEDLRPVPMLSFSVRHLGCAAGIVITASHNPPQYNGYKVYWSDGGQITPETCAPITELISQTDPLTVKFMDKSAALSSGLLEYIGEAVDNAYYSYTTTLALHNELTAEERAAVKVVYTPLHGSGLKPVTALLNKFGFTDLHIVEEQKEPDGQFPTVEAPNPENKTAFSLALSLAKDINADIALATDPDADRLGVCIRDGKGGYTALTGNAIGALLIEYILSALHDKNALPSDAFVVESIVSTRLAERICNRFGVELRRVLTGFRYIAEQIEKSVRYDKGHFIFGFEESCGFLSGTEVRDKDACLAATLICEACAYYKSHGKDLHRVISEMEDTYGVYAEKCISFDVQGKDGMEKLRAYMEKLHKEPKSDIAGLTVTAVTDYEKGSTLNHTSGEAIPTGLPKSNVIIYALGDAAWVCMRPSGTEPKLKVYVGVNAKDRQTADELLMQISDAVSTDTAAQLKC